MARFGKLLKSAATGTASFWQALRSMAGDDAYERYLSHWQSTHSEEGGEPLSRKAYFRAELERRWSGIKRCC